MSGCPRIAAAVVVGAALAMSGCVMQNVLRNPLASASTLGVSQGASFGAAVAIICLGAGSQINSGGSSAALTISNPYLVTACAFLGGMATTVLILALSRVRGVTPSTMVLAGVAISSMFTGGTTLVQYFADDVMVATVVYWTFGSLGRAGWQEIALIGLLCLLALAFFLFHRWNYNAMESGIHTARSLGVPVEFLIPASMAVCALIASVSVAFVGCISFIGLIASHIMRVFVGNDYRFLIPCSAMAGAVLLLASDIACRILIPPVVLPIGALTSFLGCTAVFVSHHETGECQMIEVQNLSFSYGHHPVLSHVGFTAQSGECVGILGNNGAGKSTLITCINRIRTPDSGSVLIDGKAVGSMSRRELARSVAYVAQKNEMSQTTVFDCVLLGRKPYIRWAVGEEDLRLCTAMIHRVGLEALELRSLDELSGGELQKVMLARALVQRPKVLLLDEPTSNLDPRNQYEMMELVREVAREQHITVLIVIHDLNLALRYCDRFFFLKDGSGYRYGGMEVVDQSTIESVYGVCAKVMDVGGRRIVIIE